MQVRFARLLTLAVMGIGFCGVVERPARSQEALDFARDVQPILSDNCYACHGPDESSREAELRLDDETSFRESGVVVAGASAESELLRRITTNDPDERMPPPSSNLALSQAQIDVIKKWIDQGAEWSVHWAYRPITRPPLPARKTEWGRNPIDAFVLAKMEQHGLHPASRANPRRLLRRVTLDLTGIAPPIELQRKLGDELSAEQYERIVDRLLGSPRYGERMAWPWLDAARYADTNGFQGDNERTMWPWRDWVIDALNRNVPYDEFTVWQIAGDLLPKPTLEQRLATGFCRNHMINGEGGRIPEENRVEYIFDQIETLSTVWLGTTLQCCRCHDHKFDPITQDEYYQLFAYFNQTPVDGSGRNPQTPPVVSVADASIQRQQSRLADTLLRQLDALRRLEQQFRSSELVQIPDEISEAISTALQMPVEQRSLDHWKQIEAVAKNSEYKQHVAAIRSTLEKRESIQRSLPRVMVMEDLPPEKSRTTKVLDRGLYNKPLHAVAAGTPKFLLPPGDASAPHANRLALARWLIDPRNPLTARVTVNRIWYLFFGNGIVETVEDFGVQGKPPTHPELLDWLAAELIRSNWDMKHIVRLIVTSETYCQSAANSDSVERDPNNRFLARGARVRMPSWMIRDHALSVSKLLVSQVGGRPVKPYQPPGVWEEATFGKKRYEQDHGADLYRRSIYTFWRRIVGPTMFFDAAKRQTCEVKVPITNTPLHALATLNDETYVEASRHIACRLVHECSSEDPADRIQFAFELTIGRPGNPDEIDRMVQRFRQLESYYRQHANEANELLSVGESPVDKSLVPSSHAAYTCICLAMLNLDEALTK